MGVVLLINKRTSDRFTAAEEDCAQTVAAALGPSPSKVLMFCSNFDPP